MTRSQSKHLGSVLGGAETHKPSTFIHLHSVVGESRAQGERLGFILNAVGSHGREIILSDSHLTR